MNCFSTTGLALCIATALTAQKEIPADLMIAEQVSPYTGLPGMAFVQPSQHVASARFTGWLQQGMALSPELSFTLLRNETDGLGMEHTRYQQYYKGYRIEGTMLISHSKGQEVASFNGEWYREMNLANSPGLDEQQALAFALKKVGAEQYKWEDKTFEAHVRRLRKDSTFSFRPKGELLIWPVIDAAAKTISFRYAYRFNIYASKPLYRANVYVDAATGAILAEQNLICTADAPGSANTRYSGTQPIVADSYAGGYRLREAGRGNGIETYNLNNLTDGSNITDFSNSTNNWITTGPDQPATDAHWGAEKTYDFYFQKYGRNSIDNAGLLLTSYVHYDTNFNNAFWDGLSMTYGDGNSAGGYKVFTGLDVCGHEITHGLVQYTAGLDFLGEASALNEGFADIFGTAIEWFARPGNCDWIMGKDITTSGFGFRNMSNPKQRQQPNTYFGQYWDPSDEPHRNNGPCIYWYYLLSMGGNGANDNGNTYSVNPIGMAKATDIAYRALSVYMTPSTSYADVRVYTILAARDLYGGCSNEVIQTTNAWYAVGVGNAYSSLPSIPAFSADLLSSCTVPTTVHFTNSSTGNASALWRFGDGATSTTYNAVHTYTATGLYNVRLVMANCNGGKDSLTKAAYIHVDPANPCVYNMPAFTSTYTGCNGTLFDDGGPTGPYEANSHRSVVIVSAPGTVINVRFESFIMEETYDFLNIYQGAGIGMLVGSFTGSALPHAGGSINTGTNVITVYQSSDGFGNFDGYKLNWSCDNFTGIDDPTSAGTIVLYPNPTSAQLTLSLPGNGIKVLHIYDAQGRLVRTGELAMETSQIDVTALSPGLYVLQVYDNAGFRAVRRFVKQE